MAITYADVEPHLPNTDAAIAAALNADKRLLRDAEIQPLQRLMVRSGMVRSVGFAGATGIIADLYPSQNAEWKRVADEFLVALVSPHKYQCSQPDEGAVIVAVNQIATANAAQLLNGYTAQSFTDELMALTGGLRYLNVTAQQVADVIAEHNALLARQQLISDYESATGAHIDLHTMDRAQIVAGMRAAADQLEGV